jgi:tRNA nucleotidyltransferase/poly(A) polymerase
MIKTIIDKLLGKEPATRSRKPRFGKREEVPASVHGIDPQLVDPRAVDVVRTLKDAGFEAYIVGGAVRDLLLGCAPKTSMWPPMPRLSKSKTCFAVPSSLASVFASCTWCTGVGVSMR